MGLCCNFCFFFFSFNAYRTPFQVCLCGCGRYSLNCERRELRIRDTSHLPQVTQLLPRVSDVGAPGGWFGGWGGETAGSEEAPVVGGLGDGPSYAQSREVTSSVFLHKQRSSRTSHHLVRPLPGGWTASSWTLEVFAPKSSENWSSSINKPGSYVPAHCVWGGG